MPNVEKIISAHNKKILNNKTIDVKPCNCKNKQDCPLAGSETSCRISNVIYKAEVKSEKDYKTYIGLTSLEFKQRLSKHKTDFKYKKYQESTKLSNHIWNLKDNNQNFEIKWSILKKVKPTNVSDKICRLCASEVNFI